jgi:hypothetical protein
MRAPLLGLVLALGCGGAQSSARAAPDGAPPCELERALASAAPRPMPGTPVSLRLPHAAELVALRGSGAVIHACGFAAAVAATLPGPDAPEVARGTADAAIEAAIAGGAACERDGSSARCTSESGVALYRVIDRGATSAVVTVVGPSTDETALARILASARIDPDGELDLLAQTGIALDPPEGMTLVAPSSAGALRFAITREEELPDVMWLFVGWENGEGHEDGSAWTDREIGVYTAALASTRLDRLDGESLAPDPEERDAFLFDAEAHGAPVVVLGTFRRDREGVFIAYARVPRSDAGTWLPRLRRHLQSFRLLP